MVWGTGYIYKLSGDLQMLTNEGDELGASCDEDRWQTEGKMYGVDKILCGIN